MAGDGTTDEETSRKPQDSKLKQQKLPAWQPILTAETVLIVFIAIGLAFIPIGVGLFLVQNNVKEFSVDYTDCDNGTAKCSDVVQVVNNTGCSCTVTIDVKENMEGKVYMYYGLTSFYQNHRRYVKSRDDNQLRGLDTSLTDDCSPYKTEGGKNIAPCGAIANSLFNDTLALTYTYQNGTTEPVSLLRTGIAWSTDRNSKFQNPSIPSGSSNLSSAFADTVKPPNWQKPVYDLDTADQANSGYQNEDLIVWMRTAALPNFRKLYRRIEQVGTFETMLPKGNYTVTVGYNFPVTMFGGTKSVILSTTSIFGGKNLFLGIAYMVVGSLCIVLGIVFLIIHRKFGKKAEAMTTIDRQTPY